MQIVQNGPENRLAHAVFKKNVEGLVSQIKTWLMQEKYIDVLPIGELLHEVMRVQISSMMFNRNITIR
jgi:hypothetical protein